MSRPQTRKALLVGINYRGTSNELQGCINDVLQVKELLLKKGYTQNDIMLMTDDTSVKPTKNNIIYQLVSLILSGADQLYFHYSGHGTQLKDTNGDEPDSLDEAICPIDCDTKGMLLDDELRGLLQLVSEQQKLTVILDCCHSGSGLDLSYVAYSRLGQPRMTLVRENTKSGSETRGQVVMFSGCQDRQTSADAFLNNKSQGALTCAYLTALNSNCSTYEDILNFMLKFMKDNKFEQVPNFTCGRVIDLRSKFNF